MKEEKNEEAANKILWIDKLYMRLEGTNAAS